MAKIKMSDQAYMQRALQLAKLGFGQTSPNPMVGCVIVHENVIIGEGYHMVYGGPHAEVNAVNAVENKELLKESTVYVTLEPCSHFGKTPPCADLLVSHQVKKVVVCNIDPNPKVAGSGVKRLQDAGIEVEVGLLEEEGEELNRRFFTAFRKKRPYVILKWAQTADGFISRKNFDSKWISNQYSRQMVHKWRSEEDAIMVGTNTVHYDNPSLTTRSWNGKDPVRIVVDRDLRLNRDLNLFDGSVKTICFTEKDAESLPNLKFIRLDTVSPELMLGALSEEGINSVIIEGGSGLINSFEGEDLWDEARVFTSKTTFGEGIDAPKLKSEPFDTESVFEDQLTYYRNSHG